jgi:hypothetical protein
VKVTVFRTQLCISITGLDGAMCRNGDRHRGTESSSSEQEPSQ